MNSSGHGVMLVEDDEHDIFFMRRAMSMAGLEPPIFVAKNGQEAVDYLSGSGQFCNRGSFPLPSCIFLDLKLPFIHGFQVLEWIRGQQHLHDIAVVVLTSSPEERDRERAKELGARSYMIKPPSAKLLQELSAILPGCWVRPGAPG